MSHSSQEFSLPPIFANAIASAERAQQGLSDINEEIDGFLSRRNSMMGNLKGLAEFTPRSASIPPTHFIAAAASAQRGIEEISELRAQIKRLEREIQDSKALIRSLQQDLASQPKELKFVLDSLQSRHPEIFKEIQTNLELHRRCEALKGTKKNL